MAADLGKCFQQQKSKKNPNHSRLFQMLTGKPDPSQTDLEVPRPTSSTSFPLFRTTLGFGPPGERGLGCGP